MNVIRVMIADAVESMASAMQMDDDEPGVIVNELNYVLKVIEGIAIMLERKGVNVDRCEMIRRLMGRVDRTGGVKCIEHQTAQRIEELTETVCRDNAEIDRLREELGKREGQPVMMAVPDIGAPLPRYEHEGDAGMDVRSRVDLSVRPMEPVAIKTGLRVAIPEGHVGLLLARSGLGSRGITLRNAVGVIDSGYRGEVRVPLWNTTDEPFEVREGDRIAQLVVVPFARCRVEYATELPPSGRGEGGFGSTGVA